MLPKLEKVGGGRLYRVAKRAFDVVASSFALIIMAIPMLVIACLIKHESEGPIVYAQARLGKSGKEFKLYKFRSMYVDAEKQGMQWAHKRDPRITPIGLRLRAARLDEVPQFWNVIKGDMSLIGPRPERKIFHEEFTKRIIGWDQRLVVRPGLSGLAQIEGGYELLPKDKGRLDIQYIENRGFILDLKLMLRTMSIVLTGRGSR